MYKKVLALSFWATLSTSFAQTQALSALLGSLESSCGLSKQENLSFSQRLDSVVDKVEEFLNIDPSMSNVFKSFNQKLSYIGQLVQDLLDNKSFYSIDPSFESKIRSVVVNLKTLIQKKAEG